MSNVHVKGAIRTETRDYGIGGFACFCLFIIAIAMITVAGSFWRIADAMETQNRIQMEIHDINEYEIQ